MSRKRLALFLLDPGGEVEWSANFTCGFTREDQKVSIHIDPFFFGEFAEDGGDHLLASAPPRERGFEFFGGTVPAREFSKRVGAEFFWGILRGFLVHSPFP